MGLKISLKRFRRWFDSKQLLFTWYRHYKLLFFILFCGVLGFGGFAWYYNLYTYEWNDEQKKGFLETYVKETNFKETRYRETADRLKDLTEKHKEIPTVHKNIFTGEDVPAR